MSSHPNRGPKGPFVELDSIHGSRLNANPPPARVMTQKQAGELVYASERTWQDWERGQRKMPYSAYELFLLKTGQMTIAEAKASKPA